MLSLFFLCLLDAAVSDPQDKRAKKEFILRQAAVDLTRALEDMRSKVGIVQSHDFRSEDSSLNEKMAELRTQIDGARLLIGRSLTQISELLSNIKGSAEKLTVSSVTLAIDPASISRVVRPEKVSDEALVLIEGRCAESLSTIKSEEFQRRSLSERIRYLKSVKKQTETDMKYLNAVIQTLKMGSNGFRQKLLEFQSRCYCLDALKQFSRSLCGSFARFAAFHDRKAKLDEKKKAAEEFSSRIQDMEKDMPPVLISEPQDFFQEVSELEEAHLAMVDYGNCSETTTNRV